MINQYGDSGILTVPKGRLAVSTGKHGVLTRLRFLTNSQTYQGLLGVDVSNRRAQRRY